LADVYNIRLKKNNIKYPPFKSKYIKYLSYKKTYTGYPRIKKYVGYLSLNNKYWIYRADIGYLIF